MEIGFRENINHTTLRTVSGLRAQREIEQVRHCHGQSGLDSYGRRSQLGQRIIAIQLYMARKGQELAQDELRRLFRSYWSCAAGFVCRLLRRRIARNRRRRKEGNTLFTSIQLQEERLPQLDQL